MQSKCLLRVSSHIDFIGQVFIVNAPNLYRFVEEMQSEAKNLDVVDRPFLTMGDFAREKMAPEDILR